MSWPLETDYAVIAIQSNYSKSENAHSNTQALKIKRKQIQFYITIIILAQTLDELAFKSMDY